MNLDLPTLSFTVYRCTSKLSLKNRYRLSLLNYIGGSLLVFPLIILAIRLYESIGKPPGIGWVLLVLVIVIWFSILFLGHRLVEGKLHEIGMVTFTYEGIELTGFDSKFIKYDELEYLSTDFERPDKGSTRHNEIAKTYLVHIITTNNERYTFIAARLSHTEPEKKDLINVLEYMRSQNHTMYKKLRGVKRYYGQS